MSPRQRVVSEVGEREFYYGLYVSDDGDEIALYIKMKYDASNVTEEEARKAIAHIRSKSAEHKALLEGDD